MAEAIKYDSVLPQLLTQLLGNKTTQSADTTGLQTVLNQQLQSSTPQGMQDALTNLFTQGAQQVPVLTQAMANSVGTRSGNNSGLTLSLNELNKTLAGQAAQLSMQQQQNAAQTAAQLANASRTTTSGVANKGDAALAALGGTALNWADKNGLTKKLTDGITGLFGGGSSDPTAGSANNALDGLLSLNDNFSSAAGPSFGDTGSALTSSALDSAGSLLDDIGSSISSGASDAANWISSFFADGGEVKAPPSGSQVTPAGEQLLESGETAPPDLLTCLLDAHDGVIKAANGKVKALTDMHEKATGRGAYADGGIVKPGYADGGIIRNQNQMGGRPSTAGSSRALNYSGYAPVKSAADTGATMEGNYSKEATSWGTPEQNSAMLGGAGLTALGLLGVPSLALAALSKFSDVQTMPAQVASAVMSQIKGDVNPTSTALSVNANALADQATAAGTPTDPMDAAMQLTNAFGTGGGAGGGYGDRGPGGSSGEAGAAAAGASAAGPGSYSNGGDIQGPGTGTSDSIPARLSDGEFVLSADVVRAVGKDRLQALQDRYHTPAVVQRAAGMR